MIVEWSAARGAPMRGEVQAWVVIDNLLQAVVLSGGKIYSVPRYLLAVVPEPTPPAPAGMARIERHLTALETTGRFAHACPDLDQELRHDGTT